MRSDCFEDLLLEGSFSFYPDSLDHYIVQLTRKNLNVHRLNVSSFKRTVVECIPYKDISGCQCSEQIKDVNNKQESYIYVYAYPSRTWITGKYSAKVTLEFCVDKYDSFEENFKEAKKWQKAITSLCRESKLPTTDSKYMVNVL